MAVSKRVMGVGLCVALASGSAIAAPPSTEKVQQLIEMMGVPAQFTDMNNQMTSMMSLQFPCVDASYWQTYIDKNGQAQLVQAMIPAYQHHFSAEDVDGLIKFYKTPLGQRLVSQMPGTMTEAAQAVQQWGRQRTSEMFAELQKSGKLDAQGRCPASTSGGSTGSPGAPSGGGSPSQP
ncbi:DUF2059 domain-containing protein [Dyella dinghuensis]|uniref:DUF2059 domain-containing protein n=1 Tax=Dyella dinghuensis TaxID=1920169 RepID=A0A3S0RFT5_9GAMM|nr:DUF2059 domain-containing protein [Dyella dinghuensis]RUL66272.1 DUF2059 domain-containing protein [Dyella dinghuensis]